MNQSKNRDGMEAMNKKLYNAMMLAELLQSNVAHAAQAVGFAPENNELESELRLRWEMIHGFLLVMSNDLQCMIDSRKRDIEIRHMQERLMEQRTKREKHSAGIAVEVNDEY